VRAAYIAFLLRREAARANVRQTTLSDLPELDRRAAEAIAYEVKAAGQKLVHSPKWAAERVRRVYNTPGKERIQATIARWVDEELLTACRPRSKAEAIALERLVLGAEGQLYISPEDALRARELLGEIAVEGIPKKQFLAAFDRRPAIALSERVFWYRPGEDSVLGLPVGLYNSNLSFPLSDSLGGAR
jgi:hypothetical protein